MDEELKDSVALADDDNEKWIHIKDIVTKAFDENDEHNTPILQDKVQGVHRLAEQPMVCIQDEHVEHCWRNRRLRENSGVRQST